MLHEQFLRRLKSAFYHFFQPDLMDEPPPDDVPYVSNI